MCVQLPRRVALALLAHPRPALEDEDLLSESEDLTVSMVRHQASREGGDGREKQEDDVPDHDPRIILQSKRVKAKKALSSGTHSLRRLVLGHHGTYRLG